VHPDSITATKEGIDAGWYIVCIGRVKAEGARGPGGLPWLDFRFLKKFMQLNANLEVRCPRELREAAIPVTEEQELSLFF